MNLMLLCAGEGTRLRPHTYFMPKPQIPFLTVPMAAYGVEWARELNPRRLFVNTYHLPDKIHTLFHTLDLGIDELRFSDEYPLLMGPGGGLMKARTQLGLDTLLLMNGDEVFLPSKPGQLQKIKEEHESSGRLATLIVMNHEGVGKQFGGVWSRGQDVLGFGKTPTDGSEKGWHYIGAAFFSPRIFSFLPEGRASNILYDGLVSAIRAGEKVSYAPVQGWWHETGNEKDYLEGSASAFKTIFQSGPEADFLKALLKRHSPNAKWIESKAGNFLSADGNLEGADQCRGLGVLGRGARFTEGSTNENAVLGDGVHAGSLKNQLILL